MTDLNATEHLFPVHRIHLLSITLIKSSQNLLEPFGAKLLHPAERIIGQRDPKRFDASVDLVDT